ncbi:hypothetical protein BEN48_04155 [Hymenobacter glacialis]|uniref:Outer membrane protein beta-barrel domain-containing protein n=1 Tax=Hymenobacter glacialis TaxID=1908236 RepID=A0A1G1SWG0_9BACT|nr:hypothetical protein BEN48_04155 [Hymenobacter glacialis]
MLLAAAGLVVSLPAVAQRRNVANLSLQPEAQVELALKGNDYLLVGISALAPLNNVSGPTFAGGQLRLGYERFWSEKWSGGATLRVLGGPSDGYGDFIGQAGNLIAGLLLRHTSTAGSFVFGQRLGAEYGTAYNAQGRDVKDRALARLRFDVERPLTVGEKVTLRPRLAYEAAAYVRLQRDDNELKERVVDFGNLRGEVGLRFSPALDITPWVAYQTWYINTLPQFDNTGKQVGGGRTNLLTPLLGLDLRLTFGSTAAGTERRQLPTQH